MPSARDPSGYRPRRRSSWHRQPTAGVGVDELGRPLGVPARDPFAATRDPAAPPLDVLCAGTVFYDLVFTGMDGPPEPGRERWTAGMGSSPGGVANLAVALRRLGVRTGLAACFAEDAYGDYCVRTLAGQEGVDLSLSRRCAGWHSPVTVSMAYDADRALVTHGHEPPLSCDELLADPPACRAVAVSLGGPESTGWARAASARGALVVADVGWDPSGAWPETVLDELGWCSAFLPNDTEAMRYTRTDTPSAALARLADRVPVAVVTRGGHGAIAVDQVTGESAAVPGVAVDALDPTGAGDVFVAGFTTATLAGWPLERRLRFAALTAALAVRHFGGSLAAPGWADVDAWWRGARERGGEQAGAYGFLDEVIPAPGPTENTDLPRAAPTIGFGTRA